MGTVSAPQAGSEDRLVKLHERAERQYPESWVPESPGDTIVGEFVRLDAGTTSYGEQAIAVVRTSDGAERGIWLLHAVLRGEFAKQRPRPGELVLVRYDGKRESAAGHSYAGYRVEVDREQRAPDWDSLTAEDDGTPAAEQDDGDIPF